MDAQDIEDLFAPVGHVRLKRMFGGLGVYLDDLIVALKLSTGEVMLKGDDLVAQSYEAAGGRRWAYSRELPSGETKRTAMPYWTIPEVCFDDVDELRRFTRMALEASRRADHAKAKPAAGKAKKPAAEKSKKKPAARAPKK